MTRNPLAALSAVAVLMLVSSCGGGDDPGGTSAFTDLGADEIVKAAQSDMKSLDSLRFGGEIDSSGQEITLDMQVASGGTCSGTIGVAGGSAELLGVDGSTWFKPDEEFWQASAGPQADLIIGAVGDKWVLLPPGDASFGQFCDLDQFLDEIFADDSGSYTKGEIGEVDGQATLTITKDDEEGGSSDGFILVEGDHYIVKFEKTGDTGGSLTFSDFDEEFSAEAPADDEVIDLSSLGG